MILLFIQNTVYSNNSQPTNSIRLKEIKINFIIYSVFWWVFANLMTPLTTKVLSKHFFNFVLLFIFIGTRGHSQTCGGPGASRKANQALVKWLHMLHKIVIMKSSYSFSFNWLRTAHQKRPVFGTLKLMDLNIDLTINECIFY